MKTYLLTLAVLLASLACFSLVVLLSLPETPPTRERPVSAQTVQGAGGCATTVRGDTALFQITTTELINCGGDVPE